MKGSYTPYGDRGDNFPDQARKAVERTVEVLKEKGITFMGFDIHGLPCHKGRSDELGKIDLNRLATSKDYKKVPKFGVFSKEHSKAIQIAFHDVKYYYEIIKNVL